MTLLTGKEAEESSMIEELELLRVLRRRVDELDVTMLFRTHGGSVVYPAARVEVTVESWDNLMDAIGDLERLDADRSEP